MSYTPEAKSAIYDCFLKIVICWGWVVESWLSCHDIVSVMVAVSHVTTLVTWSAVPPMKCPHCWQTAWCKSAVPAVTEVRPNRRMTCWLTHQTCFQQYVMLSAFTSFCLPSQMQL